MSAVATQSVATAFRGGDQLEVLTFELNGEVFALGGRARGEVGRPGGGRDGEEGGQGQEGTHGAGVLRIGGGRTPQRRHNPPICSSDFRSIAPQPSAGPGQLIVRNIRSGTQERGRSQVLAS